MSRSITYDDRQLRDLFAQMDEKQRAKSLRGAFQATAGILRRAAVSNLRESIRSTRELEKGVRALVFKERLGFRVTVGTTIRRTKDRHGWQGVHGFYANRQVRKKPSKYAVRPVLIWAEDGTAVRRWKGQREKHQTNSGTREHYMYNGAFRGRMRAYRFLDRANQRVGTQINQLLQTNYRSSVEKVAKKYGCVA